MGTDDLLEPGWRSTMRQVNGLALHVVEAGPEDGPLLILLHGLPEFWWAWRHQIAVVAWWVGATCPGRLCRLAALCGPPPDVRAGQALRHPTQALRSTYVAFFRLPWAPEASLGALDFAGLTAMMRASATADTFEPDALERYAEAWAHPGSLTAMLNCCRALREREAPREPAPIAPPTLILWAGRGSFLERHVADWSWGTTRPAGSTPSRPSGSTPRS